MLEDRRFEKDFYVIKVSLMSMPLSMQWSDQLFPNILDLDFLMGEFIFFHSPLFRFKLTSSARSQAEPDV